MTDHLHMLFVLYSIALSASERVITSIRGEVWAGNYSNYHLKEPGDVTLILYSTQGDADLYVLESSK